MPGKVLDSDHQIRSSGGNRHYNKQYHSQALKQLIQPTSYRLLTHKVALRAYLVSRGAGGIAYLGLLPSVATSGAAVFLRLLQFSRWSARVCHLRRLTTLSADN